MVDDVDITTLAQVTESNATFTPPLALQGGDHTVSLSVGSDATTWKFTVQAPAAPAAPQTHAAPAEALQGPALAPGTDAEAPPAAAAAGGTHADASHRRQRAPFSDERGQQLAEQAEPRTARGPHSTDKSA